MESIEELKRELEILKEERDTMLEGLERLGWPCRLVELPEYCQALIKEIEKQHRRK